MLQQILRKLKRVKEYENYYSALCVFHEDKNPSLLVFKDGWFRCLACGRTGDHKTLIRKLSGFESTSFISETTEWNAPSVPKNEESFELSVSAHRVLSKNIESLSWYLRMRKIDDRIDSQKLGWYNGWYTIPMFDELGNYKGMGLRASLHIQNATGARYVIPTKQKLYVPDWKLVHDNNYIVIVFGLFDALSLCSMRIPSASVVHGQAIRPEHLDFLRKKILLIPDDGEQEATYRLSTKLGWRGKLVPITYFDGMKDVNDLYVHGHENYVRNVISESL